MDTTTILAVMALYFLFLIFLSILASHKSSAQTFYHGDRKSPWYIVAFGMIGATLSGVTFISVPGEVGNSAFHYLQFVMGNFVGYLIVGIFLLPYYYRSNVISIYSILEKRMGRQGHLTASGFFLVSKLIGAGFRLYLVALVLQMAVANSLGIPFYVTVLFSLLVIWLYTFRSGIKAVVYSDTIQTAVLVAAVVVTIIALFREFGSGASEIIAKLSIVPETSIFDWNWQSSDFFVKQFFAGIFMTLAINGFDQDIMQKNLTCKSASQARRNMIWFSFGFVLVIILFLVLGALLYQFAAIRGIAVPARTDEFFPMIALNHLGVATALLFILGVTAAAFSSADSATTALTTAFCVDFLRINRFSVHWQKRIRVLTHIGFSVLLFFVIMGFYAFNDQSVVVAIFKAAGYTYGPILGLFLFVFLFKRTPLLNFVLPLCVAAPILTWGITLVSKQLFNYHFGFEIIILNGAITLLLLLIFSRKGENVKKD